MSPPLVRLENVRKTYGAVRAADHVSLEIAAGEFFALLGPSGCGKTTLMRMVAGFDAPDSGNIFIDGQDMHDVPPYRRPVNMMFQSYALFPHMNVARNIGFGLVQAGMPKADIETRVADMLRLVRLEGFGERRPSQLSGGQKQRVALARALAPRPKLLLLDEPLAALDRKLREETQFELMQVQRDLGIAFMIVTHDQNEAMAMAQRIAVMREGRIEQIGDARAIYDRPLTRFTAEFIGDVNLFEAEIVRRDGAVFATIKGHAHGPLRLADEDVSGEKHVVLAVRPERVTMSHLTTGKDVEFRGKIVDLAWLGNSTSWRVELADGKVLRISAGNLQAGAGIFARGDDVFAGFDMSQARVLTR